jgi:hypothetical protein
MSARNSSNGAMANRGTTSGSARGATGGAATATNRGNVSSGSTMGSANRSSGAMTASNRPGSAVSTSHALSSMEGSHSSFGSRTSSSTGSHVTNNSSFARSQFSNRAMGNAGVTNARFGTNASVVSGARLGGPLNAHMGSTSFGNRGTFGSSRFGNTGFSNGRGFNRGFGRGFDRGFGRGFDRGFGFRRGFGCWGCGFGWGWGLGWGWNPWWGWGSPWWGWSPGWAWGYPAYPYWGIGYDSPGYDSGSYSSDMSYDNTPAYNANNNADTYQTPPADRDYQGYENTNPVTGNVAATTPTVLIYLNDGTTYAATDYWLADGKLHYYVNYGGENSVDMSQVDLQRTVNENSKRGLRFSLKPNRDSSDTAPSSNEYRPRYDNKHRRPNNPPNGTTSNRNDNENAPAPATNPAPKPQPEPRMESTSQTSLSHS